MFPNYVGTFHNANDAPSTIGITKKSIYLHASESGTYLVTSMVRYKKVPNTQVSTFNTYQATVYR